MLAGIALMMSLMAYSVNQMQNEDGKLEAIEKAQDAACATQRAQMSRDILLYWVDHPTNKNPSTGDLANAGIEIPACPNEGEYEIIGRHVLCTFHSYEDEFESAERELAQGNPMRQKKNLF
jgi:hypothetical protein